MENDEFVERVLNEFNAGPSVKQWSAKKPEILHMWKNARPDTPIIITPIDDKPDGQSSSYGEDGVRVTGSWQFIASVIARLKEIIGYENPQTKLRLVFRSVDRSRSRNDRQSYVFYVNLERRGVGKAKPNVTVAKPAV